MNDSGLFFDALAYIEKVEGIGTEKPVDAEADKHRQMMQQLSAASQVL